MNRLLKNISYSKTMFFVASDINEWIRRFVNVSAIPYEFELSVMPELGGVDETFLITCGFTTTDIATNTRKKFQTQESFPCPATPVTVIQAIRAILVRVLLHELDENILIDNVRIFDPHNNSNAVKDMKIVNQLVQVDYGT